jgi:hypothetical protein
MSDRLTELTSTLLAMAEESARRLEVAPHDAEVVALAASTIRQLCSMVARAQSAQNELERMLREANERTNNVLTRLERTVGSPAGGDPT